MEQTLVDELGVRPVTARVLAARGFKDAESALRFLRPTLSQIGDPFLMAGMREAVARLVAAISNREKILIYGDYDVDGTTAVVILHKAIELAGGVVSFHVPHRLRDGYGMHTDVIERAAAEGVRVIVSVDTGIRAIGVVRAARDLGIDVIITDHHLPEAELPPALAVLNPNRRDCTYPDKRLCGAGVAFQLVRGLIGEMGWPRKRMDSLTESFLKMVAIATVADVVPLVGENRTIVKNGLPGLSNVRNVGLRALLDVAGFENGAAPTATEVAFRIAPRINAAGRMASASDVVEMFLTGDAGRARVIAGQLQALNQERQQTEAEMVKTILAECERAPVTAADAALVFSGEGWHRGVVGIVASRLVERFCRPVFVLGSDGVEASGSGRGTSAFHLLEALEAMPDLFSRFGGHRQAAGLTLPSNRIGEFRERLNTFAALRLTPDDFRRQIEIDALVELGDLDDRTVEEVLGMEPFGFGNPPPRLAALGLEVAAPPSPLGDKHLRVTLRQNGRKVTMKAWGFAARADELKPGQRVDAVFELEDDSYARARGWGTWCAVLKDVREPVF